MLFSGDAVKAEDPLLPLGRTISDSKLDEISLEEGLMELRLFRAEVTA